MTALRAGQFVRVTAVCAAALMAVVLISPGVGLRPPGILEAWRTLGRPDDPAHAIAFGLRLPRAIKAALAGVTLSLCGAVFQAVFRNPLATPYTLGIASGGSLGALIAIQIGTGWALAWPSPVTLGAFLGAGGVVLAVALLARATRGMSSNNLLLGGVAIGLFCSAMMLFVQYLAREHEAFAILRWMMGSVSTVGYREVLSVLPFAAVSWIVLAAQGRALNQYALGEEVAATRGVNPARLEGVCLGFGSLGAAAVVSICGPIGFVGLIVPHAARVSLRTFREDQRLLIPVAALLGGAFLVVCDWLTLVIGPLYGDLAGREVGAARLPIGVVTALVGAPIFLVILRRSLK